MEEKDIYKIANINSKKIAGIYGAKSNEMTAYLVGIAKTESNFNPKAMNKQSTARGLMQILICTQREVEKKYAKVDFAPAMYVCKQYQTATYPKDLDKMFDPAYAMFIAAHYLGYQYRRYKGNWDKAIHSYNQGSYPANEKAGLSYLHKVKANADYKYAIGSLPNLILEYY